MACIEDVLRAYHRVNPDMTEEDQLCHLFKRPSHNLFPAIALQPPIIVVVFATECKRYEDLQSRWIFQESFEHLPEGTPSSARNNLLPSFHKVVKEELQHFPSHLRAAFPDHHVVHIMQEQVQSMLQPFQQPVAWNCLPSPSTIGCCCKNLCSVQHKQPNKSREHPSPPYQFPQTVILCRRKDVWRTPVYAPYFLRSYSAMQNFCPTFKQILHEIWQKA